MKIDKVIANYQVVDQIADSLINITDKGVAYQARETDPIEYGEEYFQRYSSYRGTEISKCINSSRIDLLKRFGEPAALDIGIGSGEFLETANAAGVQCFGFDVNPIAIEYLKRRGFFVNPTNGVSTQGINTVTFWDVFEHLEEPSTFVSDLGIETIIMSVPIVEDFSCLLGWKHFKPGEHLYYFTNEGMISFMDEIGYKLAYSGRPECDCGREDIGSFVFNLK